MKLGILETGAPPGNLAGRFGDYPAMFARLLGDSYRYSRHDVAESLPANPADCDAWLLTGSPAGVYDDLPWIARLTDFLREVKGKAKLVGICFGHQIMAEAFGGHVTKSPNGWGIGLHRYRIHDRASWMDDAAAISVPVSHQDQIVIQPPNTRLLAGSDFTRFGVIAYEDQPAISFQCHPEFEPDFAKALIGARRERLPDPDAAIASLDRPNDRIRVGQWIGRFLAA